MNRLRLWIRNIFGFSRGEANGFLILLPLMLLILFSNPLYRLLFEDNSKIDIEENTMLDSLLANWNDSSDNVVVGKDIVLFQIDPNLASKAEFEKLGLPAYLSNRIINYRANGGSFRQPADLLKIYGMDSALYVAIAPYIYIESKIIKETKIKNSSPGKRRKENLNISFDLNQADTTQLKSIYGIGSVLSGRIVKYRNMLGGFVDENQLKEVYGLDSAIISKLAKQSHIRPDFIPIQLNINNATEKELSKHPYISYKMAKTIIAYRFQHGKFNEIDDLLKIDLIHQEEYNRIKPYLKLEP